MFMSVSYTHLDVYKRQDYKKPVQPEKKGNETLLQRKETKQETNAEFEFRPVLSPIYGNTADEEKKKQKIHDAVHLPKSKTKNPLNTVLSPMYGEFELENFEKEAKQKLQERRVQKELHIEPSLISEAAVSYTHLYEEKDVRVNMQH